MVVQANADPNLLVNGSFENLNFSPIGKISTGLGGGTVPGWTGNVATDSGISENPPVGDIKSPGAEDGTVAAYFKQEDGYAEQTTVTPIATGLSYDLKFWSMNIDTYNSSWSGGANGQISVEVYAGTDANAIGTYNVNVGLSSDGNVPGTWLQQDVAIPSSAIPGGDVGQLLGIKIWNTSDLLNPIAGSWIYVDNVVLVPEPTTAALLGFGTLATMLGLHRTKLLREQEPPPAHHHARPVKEG